MKLSFYFFMTLCVCLFLMLGIWQVKRLAWKENLLAQVNAEVSVDVAAKQLNPSDLYLEQSYSVRRGYLKGQLDLAQSILWRGQIFNGAPVNYVVAPFRLTNDTSILPVVVGMCFAECDEVKAKNYKNIKLVGTLKRHRDNMFRPANNIAQSEWYRMNVGDLSAQWKSPVYDALFYAENNNLDPYLAPVPSVINIPNNHKQYAIFWFAMAGIISLLTVYQFVSFRRGK